MLRCLNSDCAVERCSTLTLLPTEVAPVTQALAIGTQVLGRQQLQQSTKHLMVPLGKNLCSLP